MQPEITPADDDEASVRYGWINPFADVAVPKTPVRRAASSGERLMAVIIDFVALKLLTSAIALTVTGGAMFALMSGADGDVVPTTATHWTYGLSVIVSVGYFLLRPAFNEGQTLGRRLAGIAPRSNDSEPTSRSTIARHDAIAFLLPSLLLDPIAVLGIRDIAVLGAWCAYQAIRPSAERTYLERALSIRMDQRP